jgi:hypothetical protein
VCVLSFSPSLAASSGGGSASSSLLPLFVARSGSQLAALPQDVPIHLKRSEAGVAARYPPFARYLFSVVYLARAGWAPRYVRESERGHLARLAHLMEPKPRGHKIKLATLICIWLLAALGDAPAPATTTTNVTQEFGSSN